MVLAGLSVAVASLLGLDSPVDCYDSGGALGGEVMAPWSDDMWNYVSGLPFTDAELERFQETLRQGTTQAPQQGFTVGIIDANGNPQPNPDAMDYDAWIKKYFGDDLDAARKAVEGEVSRRGLPPEVEVSPCTAKPSCGFPDEECPVCKAGNCPGAKCWRGCEVRR
jgi:hypothetical protein